MVVFPFLFACLRCVKCFSNSYHDKDDVYCDGNKYYTKRIPRVRKFYLRGHKGLTKNKMFNFKKGPGSKVKNLKS